MAQDLERLLPQLVSKADNGEESLSVNYIGLIPVLVNAVQEQQKVLDKQKLKIEQLEEALLAIQKKLNM